MRGCIVFLGPSCDLETAREILPGAEFRPPAARGDIARAAEGGARVIVLIDGVFLQDCAVGHREVLGVLRAGTTVIGASSMGALRAAELDGLGMVGIGEVYRRFRDGELESDDEVALVYDPESGCALSEPLVNIRATLEEAVAAGVISPDGAGAVLEAARGLYFPERTWASVLRRADLPDGVREVLVRRPPVDLKRADAIAALEYARGL
ncbi:MAG: TfuA-related McrA-glycine thioamidation protein [Methanospirillum sp.]|nr:TfuA-related McrA-glycine thioamidation protein [Methanospirillum sp.]